MTDAHLLENCILDLAVTNSFVFGSQYAHAQQVLAARAALSPAKGPAVLSSLTFSGEILDSKSRPEFHFHANEGDVLWLGNPDCTDRVEPFAHVFLVLQDAAGKQLGDAAPGCDFGRRELPATGIYTLRANFGFPHAITRWRIPLRFVRPTRRLPVAYGQMVSGTVEHKAAQDVYSWHGEAGDLVLISGAGCDLGPVLTDILEPNGHELLGPSCRTGTEYRLPVSGTYQLIVNAYNAGPGAYHFVFQGGKPAIK